jgi:hypothetical protein
MTSTAANGIAFCVPNKNDPPPPLKRCVICERKLFQDVVDRESLPIRHRVFTDPHDHPLSVMSSRYTHAADFYVCRVLLTSRKKGILSG